MTTERVIDLGERGTVRIVENGEALAQAAAAEFAQVSQSAADAGRTALIALSGGSTPKRMGQLLNEPDYAARVRWDVCQFFWGDERWVPLSSPDSNAGEAMRIFLTNAPVSNDQMHSWDTETGISPAEAAARYEHKIRKYSGTRDGGVPVFDLVFVGMGDDGHTLSLFPGTTAMHDTESLTIAHHVPKLNADRLTFGPALANAAKKVVFLVGGAGKAAILKQVLEGEVNIDLTPSQVIRPTNGTLEWIVDEAAAANLEGSADGNR